MSESTPESSPTATNGAARRPVPVMAAGVMAAVALVVGLVIGSSLGGNETEAAANPADHPTSSSTTSTTAPTTTAPTTTAPTTTTSEVPQRGSREDPLEMGETFEIGGARVTVTSLDLEADTWLSEYDARNEAPPEGFRWAIVHRSVTNIGHEPFWPLVYPTMTIADNHGSSCHEIRYWPDPIGFEPSIYPEGAAQGNHCIKVAANAIEQGEILLEFRGRQFSDVIYVKP